MLSSWTGSPHVPWDCYVCDIPAGHSVWIAKPLCLLGFCWWWCCWVAYFFLLSFVILSCKLIFIDSHTHDSSLRACSGKVHLLLFAWWHLAVAQRHCQLRTTLHSQVVLKKKSNSINSVPQTCECTFVVVGNSQERLRNNPCLLPSKEGLAGRLPLHRPLQGESFLSSSCLIESVAPREPGIAQKCLILFLTYPRLSFLFCLHGHGAGVQNPGE